MEFSRLYFPRETDGFGKRRDLCYAHKHTCAIFFPIIKSQCGRVIGWMLF